jgi:hypothetical protein
MARVGVPTGAFAAQNPYSGSNTKKYAIIKIDLRLISDLLT